MLLDSPGNRSDLDGRAGELRTGLSAVVTPPRAPAQGEVHRRGPLAFVAPSARSGDVLRLMELVPPLAWADMPIACDSAKDLESAPIDHGLRILVVHSDMVKQVGLDCLARLRSRFPALDWVLAWQGRTPDLADLVIRLRARACIDLKQPGQAAQALERVAEGELWLPRWVLHEIYTLSLEERRARAVSADAADGAPGPALTRRESAVLVLLHQGCTNREIGDRLDISVSTVKKHLKNALDKRGLHSRRQALG